MSKFQKNEKICPKKSFWGKIETLESWLPLEVEVVGWCFKDLERGLPRAKLLAELAPYCTEAELHEVEGLDKEDTVTEATEVVQAVASLPVTELLAVTPAPPAGPAAAAVDDVDVKGPGDPA